MQSQKVSFSLRPIGHIRTVFNHKFGTPRQGLLAPHGQATFQLAPKWRNKGIFEALEGFSHVWLISLFHLNRNVRNPSKIHPPRLLGQRVGVLASRSPHRPNPIGLTLAKIASVEGDCLALTGIDLIDGTPILDIKPYLAEADRPETYSNGWTGALPPNTLSCEFTAEAVRDMADLHRDGLIKNVAQFVALAEEVLHLDPRPLSYREKGYEHFFIVLGGLDVQAHFANGTFRVISVRLYDGPFKAGPPAQAWNHDQCDKSEA